MRISEVETWLVQGAKYNWTILRITTEDGMSGIGEATNWPGSPIVLEAVRHAGSRIIGDDSRRIDFIWNKLYRDLNWLGPTGAVLCAISGIDMALHDLNAKRLSVPLYQLMGGAFRTEIDLYGNYWFIGAEHDPADYARHARAAVERGFSGLKFDPFAHTAYFYGEDLTTNLALTPAQEKRAIDVVAAVREAVGPDVLLLIETHALLDSATAVRLAGRLEPFSIGWYEEPVGPENPSALATLKRRIRLPIAVGERHYTRFGIREVLELGAADYLMPDIARCGGPGELRRMAAMAETYYVPIAPHNPNGPLSTLASAHVCAAIPNFFRLEFIVNDVAWRDTIMSQPLDVPRGQLRRSERPGLGVELVDAELAAHPGVVEPTPGHYV
jgi:galactonate dehydratase